MEAFRVAIQVVLLKMCLNQIPEAALERPLESLHLEAGTLVSCPKSPVRGWRAQLGPEKPKREEGMLTGFATGWCWGARVEFCLNVGWGGDGILSGSEESGNQEGF
jgi:hypothetical protein